MGCQGAGNKVEDLLGFHRQPPPAVTQVEWNRLESLGIKLLAICESISRGSHSAPCHRSVGVCGI